MASLNIPRTINKLCEILGIPGDVRVTSIGMHAECGCVPTFTITRLATDAEVEQVAAVLRDEGRRAEDVVERPAAISGALHLLRDKLLVAKNNHGGRIVVTLPAGYSGKIPACPECGTLPGNIHKEGCLVRVGEKVAAGYARAMRKAKAAFVEAAKSGRITPDFKAEMQQEPSEPHDFAVGDKVRSDTFSGVRTVIAIDTYMTKGGQLLTVHAPLSETEDMVGVVEGARCVLADEPTFAVGDLVTCEAVFAGVGTVIAWDEEDGKRRLLVLDTSYHDFYVSAERCRKASRAPLASIRHGHDVKTFAAAAAAGFIAGADPKAPFREPPAAEAMDATEPKPDAPSEGDLASGSWRDKPSLL